MTREEAIRVLKDTYAHWLRLKDEDILPCSECEKVTEAIDMAISALSAETATLNHEKVRIIDTDSVEKVQSEQVTSKLKNPCDSLLTDDSAECKEQKSKLDLISRADAIDAVRYLIYDRQEKGAKPFKWWFIKQKLNAIPSADRPSGEWIKGVVDFSDGSHCYGYKCSVCGYETLEESNYCCVCGARMKGGAE